MRGSGLLTVCLLAAGQVVLAAGGPETGPLGDAVPELALRRAPKAVRGICAEGRPLLAGDGREVALVSILRHEAWIFNGRHVDRWMLRLPTGDGRLLAPAAFSSRDGWLALFAFRPPRIVLYEDGTLSDEIPVETFPSALAIRRGELLVGVVPHLSDPEEVGRPFVYLRSYDPGMKSWTDVLSVEPPDWAQLEERALIEEAQKRAEAKGLKHFSLGNSEQRLWSSGLVAVRRDRKLWFVNRYDGAVTLLSRSGSTLWKGQVPGVTRAGFSAKETTKLEAALSSFPMGARVQSLARFRPQILSLAVHDDDLAVLFRADGMQGLRLGVLEDMTGRWYVWRLPDGVSPRTIAVLDDTLWFANPCRTATWPGLLKDDASVEKPVPPSSTPAPSVPDGHAPS